MTAVDVDALDKLREAWAAGGWPAVDAMFAVQRALPDLLAEVRRGRALRERLEGLAEEHQPVWAEDHFANERIRRDMCSCGESFHDACDVRIALDSLRAVLAAVDPS